MATINDYIKKAKIQGFSLTKFLDSNESSELRKIKDPSIKVFYNGGYDDAERVRAIILDRTEQDPLDYEFELGIIKVIPKSDMREITHRHVLGTLMSFGIKRETIGDIVVNSKDIYIFTISEVIPIILDNLKDINRIGVIVEKCSSSDFICEVKTEIRNINVASLRLDAIISKVLNKSRNDTNDIINKGLVQINHIECLNNSYQLKNNDLISVRHFGRIEVKEIVNITKKDRLVLEVIIKH